MKKNKLTGNLLYGQSGGPTSVINTSAYGLFKEAFKHKEIKKIYAMHYGIEGLLKEDLILVKNNNNLSKLTTTPGAYFGSNRYKLLTSDKDPETYKKILEIFKKYNIRYFFYNGGNDSMDTINKIANYLEMNNYECHSIGINKTIDNDLMETDFSLGYASSAKFIANEVMEVYKDDHSYKVGRVNIIETMGRDTGWLAASSKLASLKGAGPDLIYVPEVPFDIEEFLNSVKEIYDKNKHCLVVVSEGLKNKEGKNVFEETKKKDEFNHEQLGGLAIYLASQVSKKLGFKNRYIELSLLQRCNSVFASKFEIKTALDLSKFALKSALNGETKKCVIIKRDSKIPSNFHFDLVSIDLIANKVRFLDSKYISKNGHDINKSFIDYALPLIDGEDGFVDVL